MLQLILLRHAHALLTTTDGQDINRPLSREGEQQALYQGKQLKNQKFSPQAIITSPALRTLTTAQLVAKMLHFPKNEIQEIPVLYLAEAQEILQIIGEQPCAVQRLLLVGHNPGLSQVSRLLADPMLADLSTAAAISLHYETDNWQEVAAQITLPIDIIMFNSNKE